MNADIKGYYFNAFHDLKDWNANSSLTNAGLVLKVASYFTGIAPFVIALTNYCATGNLVGRVTVVQKPLSDEEVKTTNVYKAVQGENQKLAFEKQKLASENSTLSTDIADLKAQVDQLELVIENLQKAAPENTNSAPNPQNSALIQSYKTQIATLRGELTKAQNAAQAAKSSQDTVLNQQNQQLTAQVTSLRGELAKVQREAQLAKATPAQAGSAGAVPNQDLASKEQIQGLEAKVTSLEARLKKAEQNEKLALERKDVAQKNEKDAQNRADTLLARVGKTHIKRDWQQTKIESGFPAGDDYQTEFVTKLLPFESSACDAINVLKKSILEDSPDLDDETVTKTATDMYVQKIMRPLHEACQGFISAEIQKNKDLLKAFNPDFDETKPDTTDSLFWYKGMQPKIISIVDKMTDEEVMGLLNEDAKKLHLAMLEAAGEGNIEGGEGFLPPPQLARHLLRFMAIAELSDPRCYLEPAPGARIQYKEGHTAEILSPGTRTHGRIKEGDEVEVVFPGLYFKTVDPANPSAVKLDLIVATWVRRLVK